MNNNLLPSDEFIEYEGQFYTNPQKGLDEQNSFIDNLRNIQNANNAEINAQTYNLGTAVPSNLGGLVGGEGYFTSRYQTPQTNAVAANLRAAAQAQALNEVLSNELAAQKKRYNDAYRAAQRRANTPTPTNPENPADDSVEEEDTSREVGSVEPAFSPAGSGDFTFIPKSGITSSQTLGGGGGLSLPTNNLYPSGSVRVDRNKSGVVTGLIYNGKAYSGDAARKKYDQLQNIGDITPALGPVRR